MYAVLKGCFLRAVVYADRYFLTTSSFWVVQSPPNRAGFLFTSGPLLRIYADQTAGVKDKRRMSGAELPESLREILGLPRSIFVPLDRSLLDGLLASSRRLPAGVTD